MSVHLDGHFVVEVKCDIYADVLVYVVAVSNPKINKPIAQEVWIEFGFACFHTGDCLQEKTNYLNLLPVTSSRYDPFNAPKVETENYFKDKDSQLRFGFDEMGTYYLRIYYYSG
ncbi:hypothetical protein RUM43_013098 [Polyplax serrata]|uniref:Uncharacterized protein n=1 Tax=Polyplax serrata TaxID=468196 RepID=A0AAN8NQV4_POLSC